MTMWLKNRVACSVTYFWSVAFLPDKWYIISLSRFTSSQRRAWRWIKLFHFRKLCFSVPYITSVVIHIHSFTLEVNIKLVIYQQMHYLLHLERFNFTQEIT
jgi:hypothetical protein